MSANKARNPSWSTGSHIVLRQMWRGGVWAAIPATIIEDSAALVSLYIAPGAVFAGPDCTRAEHLHVAATGAWQRKLYEWAGQHHLWSSRPHEAASIWTIWSAPDWTHVGWKVNPERPLKQGYRELRDSSGFAATTGRAEAIFKAGLA